MNRVQLLNAADSNFNISRVVGVVEEVLLLQLIHLIANLTFPQTELIQFLLTITISSNTTIIKGTTAGCNK